VYTPKRNLRESLSESFNITEIREKSRHTEEKGDYDGFNSLDSNISCSSNDERAACSSFAEVVISYREYDRNIFNVPTARCAFRSSFILSYSYGIIPSIDFWHMPYQPIVLWHLFDF
jgi:hypothetical protein